MGGEGSGASGGARLGVAGALLSLLALQACLVMIPVRRSAEPLTWEPALHLRAASAYGESPVRAFMDPPPVEGAGPQPPVFPSALAAGVRAGAFRGLPPEDGAALANVFFLFLLGWGAYLLASDWWGESAGAAAAFLVSLTPPVTAAARLLVPDTALAAWVVLSYALWESTRRFTLWGRSLALGLAGAAGLLTRWTYPLYVLPILAAVLWEVFRPAERAARWRAAAALAAAAGLASVWYGRHWTELSAALFGPSGGTSGPGGLDALFYHLGAFKDGVGWTGLAAAAGGFVWLALRHARNAWILASWLGSSYFLWTLAPEKDPRHMLPALPVLGLAAAGLPFRIPLVLAALLAGSAAWLLRAG